MIRLPDCPIRGNAAVSGDTTAVDRARRVESPRTQERLYPFLFIAKGAAPALGIARHAIDAVIESAAAKPTRRYTVGERIEAAKLLPTDVHMQEAWDVKRPFSPPLSEGCRCARRRRLRRCGAARLQGGRRHVGLPEGTVRSLPARRPENESACDRDVTNLGDGRPPAARSRTLPLTLLV